MKNSFTSKGRKSSDKSKVWFYSSLDLNAQVPKLNLTDRENKIYK